MSLNVCFVPKADIELHLKPTNTIIIGKDDSDNHKTKPANY